MVDRQQSDTAGRSFTASWTPSKATSLAATNVPLGRNPRAWERKPKPAVGENGKVKTVWKRYELRNQAGTEETNEGTQALTRSPGAIVKKLRVGSPVKGRVEETEQVRRKSAATKYERRKSGYRRKPIVVPALDAPEGSIDTQVDPTKNALTDEHLRLRNNDESVSQELEESMCEAAEAQLLDEAGIEPDLSEDSEDVPMRSASSLDEDLLLDLSSDQDKAAPGFLPDKADASHTSSSELQTSEEDGTASPDRDSSDDNIRFTFTTQQLVEIHEVQAQSNEETMDDEAQQHHSIDSIDTTTDLIFGDLYKGNSSPVKQNVPDYFAEVAADDSPAASWSSKRSSREPEESETAETAVTISLNDATVNLGALLARHQNLAATLTDDAIELEELGEADQDEEEATAPPLDEAGAEKEDEDRCSSPDELSMEFDQTETITFTTPDAMTHLEDDKAKLSSFLQRVAANKANKSANITRRESLQNRRDSDVVRKALASPGRQVLEDKDTNLSPLKPIGSNEGSTLNLDQVLASPPVKPVVRAVSQTVQTDADDSKTDDLALSETGSPRRRSSRSRTRLPTLSNATVSLTPNKIPVRTDGGGSVILNRTEAQQLADLVRRNTKKNKGTSIPAPQRLAKLKLESLATILDGASPVVERLRKEGVKNVEWNEQLVEFATSPATADLEAAPMAKEEPPQTEKKSGTPRMRRLKGLGASNGTPAKKMLQSTLLPDEMEEAKAAAAAKESAKPKTISKPETIEEEPKKQKKSRLQPPKKLVSLNPTVASLSGLPVLAGKENTVGLMSPAKKQGSKIPAPSGIPAPGSMPVKRLRGLTKKP